MKLLTKEQQELQKVTENYYICKKNYNKYVTDKKNGKVTDHCNYTREHRGAAYSICNLKYSCLKLFLYFSVMDLTMIIILS